jgi:hypothetical protein
MPGERMPVPEDGHAADGLNRNPRNGTPIASPAPGRTYPLLARSNFTGTGMDQGDLGRRQPRRVRALVTEGG